MKVEHFLRKKIDEIFSKSASGPTGPGRAGKFSIGPARPGPTRPGPGRADGPIRAGPKFSKYVGMIILIRTV